MSTDGVRVWWCEEHDASFQREPDPNPPTWGCWAAGEEVEFIDECRMVERLLIPVPDPQPATEWGPDHPSYDEMGQ